MDHIDLKTFGFTSYFEREAHAYSGLFAGRILSQHRDIYRVMSESGEITASVSGRFRYGAALISDFPAVGDFVMMDRKTDESGNAVIHHVLSRKSVFIRKAAGTSNNEQVVASNIDTVFICMSLNNDFNLRRLERYLAICWDSGAAPIIILTKADLCEEVEQRIYETSSAAAGAEILVTSSVDEESCSAVIKYIRPGETAAFIGSSGVGKSTLINRLIGEAILDTNGLRDDDKGRHTTTRRELILLKNGGMVIDTPGMRELGLESADLTRSFADIEKLAEQCRFRDCTHTKEPGCAVLQAVSDGILSAERLMNYQKLEKEVQYEGLNFKEIEVKKINEMFKGAGGMKNARKFIRENNKRK